MMRKVSYLPLKEHPRIVFLPSSISEFSVFPLSSASKS